VGDANSQKVVNSAAWRRIGRQYMEHVVAFGIQNATATKNVSDRVQPCNALCLCDFCHIYDPLLKGTCFRGEI